MRCLQSLVLRNNGIDDMLVEEINLSLVNPKITHLDLSGNHIGKQGGLALAKIFKEREPFIEWLDISRNDFHHLPQVITALVSGLKYQKNLFHLCMDTSPIQKENEEQEEFIYSEKIAGLFTSNPKLRSLGLIDSYITENAMDQMQKALTSKHRSITSLNFKFCFLGTKNIFMLCRGIEMSRSLVKLNLRSNGLPPLSGIYLMKALQDNMYLSDLDLSRNNLNDDFAQELANCLSVNDVLYRVDISSNPISEVGALSILKCLKESNETLCSLGDLES